MSTFHRHPPPYQRTFNQFVARPRAGSVADLPPVVNPSEPAPDLARFPDVAPPDQPVTTTGDTATAEGPALSGSLPPDETPGGVVEIAPRRHRPGPQRPAPWIACS